MTFCRLCKLYTTPPAQNKELLVHEEVEYIHMPWSIYIMGREPIICKHQETFTSKHHGTPPWASQYYSDPGRARLAVEPSVVEGVRRRAHQISQTICRVPAHCLSRPLRLRPRERERRIINTMFFFLSEAHTGTQKSGGSSQSLWD